MVRFPDGSGRSLAHVLSSVEAGTEIELAPGRYHGPLVIDRPLTLRGAGDLSRIQVLGRGPVLRVELSENSHSVTLESLLLEGGEGRQGAGIDLKAGQLKLHNLQIRNCHATGGGGGAIHVANGRIEARLLRAYDVSGDRGGALWVEEGGQACLTDAEFHRAQGRVGGAIAVDAGGQVSLTSVTIGRTRATAPSGGQAVYMAAGKSTLSMHRVRFEDAPMGIPLANDPEEPGLVEVRACDLPREVQSAPGVVDQGDNRWR